MKALLSVLSLLALAFPAGAESVGTWYTSFNPMNAYDVNYPTATFTPTRCGPGTNIHCATPCVWQGAMESRPDFKFLQTGGATITKLNGKNGFSIGASTTQYSKAFTTCTTPLAAQNTPTATTFTGVVYAAGDYSFSHMEQGFCGAVYVWKSDNTRGTVITNNTCDVYDLLLAPPVYTDMSFDFFRLAAVVLSTGDRICVDYYFSSHNLDGFGVSNIGIWQAIASSVTKTGIYTDNPLLTTTGEMRHTFQWGDL